MVSCSIHLTDNGLTGFLRPRIPDPAATPGLLSSQRLTAAAFSGRAWPGTPQLNRNGFIAFWEDDDAISSFLDSDKTDDKNSWHMRTSVTRAIGRWPGLPAGIDRSVHTESAGPVIGVSLGPLRFSKGFRFNQLNTGVETQLLEADGVIWKSAFFALPNILCTVSFWESANRLHRFARSGAHMDAMKASLDKDYDPSLPHGTKFFAPDSVFMSLSPYRTDGSLQGKNPLPEAVFGQLGANL